MTAPNRLSDQELDELAALEAKATPGPWREDADSRTAVVRCVINPSTGREIATFWGEDYETVRRSAENAQMVAASRNALAALIAEVRAGRKLAEACDAWNVAHERVMLRNMFGVEGEALKRGRAFTEATNEMKEALRAYRGEG
jgi:hypothetical protein